MLSFTMLALADCRAVTLSTLEKDLLLLAPGLPKNRLQRKTVCRRNC